MQLHEPTAYAVKTNMPDKMQAFTIVASAKAFQILSDKLYSDKISAPIRELACNALDSHVDSGNPDPITVHLPTILEPYFSVIDQGTGMTPDQITNLYTSYFSSSKATRNDQIGALGLGSKSPFAYTDMFSVDSVINGRHYSYSAVISQTGVPNILLLNEKDTDEHSGVRVSFPVKESDFDSFAKRAAKIFWAFEKKPTITGAVKRYKEYEGLSAGKILLSGQSWTLYKEYPEILMSRYDSKPLIKMGNILYPLEIPENHPAFSDYNFYFENKFLIEMPLGSCDIAPSREALSYDDLTIENLRDKFAAVHKDFAAQFSSQLDTLPTAWEAAVQVRKFFSDSSLKIRTNSTIPFNYKGVPYLSGGKIETKTTATLRYQYTSSRGKQVLRMQSVAAPEFVRTNLGAPTIILLDNTYRASWDSGYIKGRIRKYVESKFHHNDAIVWVVPGISKEDHALLGGIPLIRMVDLPKHTTTGAATSIKGLVGYQASSGSVVPLASIPKGKKIFILSRGKNLYADLDRMAAKAKMNFSSSFEYNVRRLEALLTETYPNTLVAGKLFVLSPSTYKKIRDKQNWIALSTVVGATARMIEKKHAGQAVAASVQSSLLSFYEVVIKEMPFITAAMDQMGVAQDSYFRTAMSTLQTLRLTKNDTLGTKKIAEINELLNRLHLNYTVQVKDIVGERKDTIALYKKYPLLKPLFADSWSSRMKEYPSFRVDAFDDRHATDTSNINSYQDVMLYIKYVDADASIKS